MWFTTKGARNEQSVCDAARQRRETLRQLVERGLHRGGAEHLDLARHAFAFVEDYFTKVPPRRA